MRDNNFFYLTRPLLLGEVPHPLLNPPSSGVEDLKPGRPGLYSQTSFNCVDFRLRSAEHSSELDALPSLARKFAPAGLLVEFYAIKLRLFDATELRLSMRRGRPCGIGGCPIAQPSSAF